jgi:hypothetical protein
LDKFLDDMAKGIKYFLTERLWTDLRILLLIGLGGKTNTSDDGM